MMQPPCFICDALRPEYADMLCAQHWLLRTVQALVQSGAWSEFDMNAWGKRPNHAAMMTDSAIAYGRARKLASRAGSDTQPDTQPDTQAYTRLEAEMAAHLAALGVGLAETPADSAGDWLAVHGLLDLPHDDTGTGRAA